MAGQRSKISQEYMYKGINWPGVVLKSSIDAMQTFAVRPDDVWVCTYPKSGTHWIGEVTGLILADGNPDKIDRTFCTSAVTMVNMAQTFPMTLEEEKLNPPNMEPFLHIVEKAPSPRLIWSHLPVRLLPPNLEKRAKIIYLARNPKDVLTSLYNFVGNTAFTGFEQWPKFVEKFMTDDIVWGPWYDHVIEYWKLRNEENVCFLFYEDMKRDPLKAARQVASTIGRTLSEDALQRVVEHSSFKGMKKTYDKVAESSEKGAFLAKLGGKQSFMGKGVAGRWKTRFTVAENEAFDKWYAEEMANSNGLKFQFE